MNVHEREMGLDEALAHEERPAGVIVGKHSWQRRGDSSSQSSLVLGADHLAVPVADRHVLVKRVDDRRVGQRVAGHADHVVARCRRVLEVHDVGLLREQEVAEVPRQHLLAGRQPVPEKWSKSEKSVYMRYWFGSLLTIVIGLSG